MTSAIEQFCAKCNLSKDQENELKAIILELVLNKQQFMFNEKISNIVPMEIDNDTPVNKTTKKNVKTTKKFATKIAEDYARDNNITLDDFDDDAGKINKSQVIQLVKKLEKSNEGSSKQHAKKQKTVDKRPCNGLTKTGDSCKTAAKAEKPDGSNFYYCAKHIENWRMFEADSDTEHEEDTHEEPENNEVDLSKKLEDFNIDSQKTEVYSDNEDIGEAELFEDNEVNEVNEVNNDEEEQESEQEIDEEDLFG